MEEGKLFLSVLVLYCHDYLKVFDGSLFKIKPFLASYNGYERGISSISLIFDQSINL